MVNNNPYSTVSDDAFREIFHSMSEGIIMVEESGTIKIANPVAQSIFGYTSDEMSGMTLENLLPGTISERSCELSKGFQR